MERQHRNQKQQSREELEQERLSRLKVQEAYDIRMIKALATVGIVCTDPSKQPMTWRAKEFFVDSRKTWITEAEAQKRWDNCQTGLVLDGWLGVGRTLTDSEKEAHLLDGDICLELPDGYIQPLPFAGELPTEVI